MVPASSLSVPSVSRVIAAALRFPAESLLPDIVSGIHSVYSFSTYLSFPELYIQNCVPAKFSLSCELPSSETDSSGTLWNGCLKTWGFICSFPKRFPKLSFLSSMSCSLYLCVMPHTLLALLADKDSL